MAPFTALFPEQFQTHCQLIDRMIDSGHNKHKLHGRGKQWQRGDVERLMRLMVMQHFLDEELFITRDGVAVAYLRTGPKSAELLSGKTNVSFK